MILEKFNKLKLISPPDWLLSNCHFIANAGSYAYGTNTEESDIDLFGFVTPPLQYIFSHLHGYLDGFGTPPPRFNRWEQSHIMFEGKEYDFSILNIVDFVNLCFKNNPDQLDILFVNRENIRHITSTGELIRHNRHKFLSKRIFWRYRGYAMSQLNKSEKENPIGKRKANRDKFGYDTKFLSHLYRLVLECEQMLAEGDLDLTRHKEKLINVKNGGSSLEEAKRWFAEKERYLEKLLETTKLPENPDEEEIKALLLKALENHYGSLDKCIKNTSNELKDILKIKEIVRNY